jgi:L-fucose isomerase-like protein
METIYLVASGDLRLSANQTCWQAQFEMEQKVIAAVEALGGHVERAHPYDPVKQHGFIDSQKYGMQVFKNIPRDAPLIVAEAVWQYSHHVLAGLLAHDGPILTVANWSGQWPGLVGMLNLNASLTKAGVEYSTLWSENFDDAFFRDGLKSWLKRGQVKHDLSHVRKFNKDDAPGDAAQIGKAFAKQLRADQAIMGVFDEGCMGMYNAIVPDELLHETGVFKERLSQSALVAKMRTVQDEEARAVYDWYLAHGMQFHYGPNEATDLTEPQVLNQCKMYIAATRMADEFGCATIGIQYQQGLKDMTCASDLVEGTLNNVERPPVYAEDGRELYAGEALPHFNEVDECAGLDGLVTYRLWKQLGYAPETTLHDLRWGRQYQGDGLDAFVWVLEISGAVPPAHFARGWRDARGERQPPMYFPLGGSTIKGVSKPGWIVWSRVFVADDELNYDTGIAQAVELPPEETEERWRLTTPQWPIMHAVLQGITRDQMMARHKSNHIQVAYTPDRASAVYGMYAKAAAMKELGLKVSICGLVE